MINFWVLFAKYFAVIFICVFLLLVIVAFFTFRAKISIEKPIREKVSFSKKLYKNYCDEAGKAISNSTISFLPQEQDKCHPNDMYYRTVTVGIRLMKTERFSLSEVGVI